MDYRSITRRASRREQSSVDESLKPADQMEMVRVEVLVVVAVVIADVANDGA